MTLIHVTGIFENIATSRRLTDAAITVEVAQSPYPDGRGAYYVLSDDDDVIRSQRVTVRVDEDDAHGTVSMLWAVGTVYRITAKGYMPDVLVYCDTLTPPVDGSDIEVAAKDLIDAPGGATPVEWVTLTAVIAGIDAKVASAVEDYLTAHPPTGGGGGVTDHGDLTGLDQDDHLIYLTAARGDARYVLPGSLAPVATTGDYASLTGTVPTSALPPLAINTVTVVATQADMLALTAERGDMAIRTDTGRTYVLASDNPATLADWKEVTAAGQVVSVAGRTGAVMLTKADVGLSSVDNTADTAKVFAGAQITSGTVAYARLPVGTAVNTVAAGDDSRFTNSRTPTAHASAHAAGGSDALTLTAAQLSDLTETVSSAVDAAVPAASPTTPGKIALASTAEATEGADTTKAVTSAGIRAALVAGIASAATLFVSPVTGNDANSGLTAGLAKATIQAAHDALPAAGGRILLAAGETVTVAATTTFTKPVDLEGARATIQATGATFDVIKLTAGASRTRIKGVRFQGGAIVGTTAQFGIFTDAATPATGVHVTECAFVDVNSGIKIAAGCDGWLVSGNEFDHLVGNASGAGYGVLVGAAKRARILANDFTASPGFGRHGVYLSAGADRCIVDGNTLDGFDEAAVSLYALAAQPPNTRCRVTNNVITNSAQSHTADSGSIQVIGANVRCVIAGNTITGSGAYGICVSNASSAGNISFRIAVLNNHVEDSWLSGIIFLSVMHPLALGNYVANSSLGTVNSHSGIRVGGFGTYAGQSASGAKIKGNTVIIGGSERYAIDLNPTAPIPTGTVVDGNIVGAGITDTIQSAGVTATIVYNTTA